MTENLYYAISLSLILTVGAMFICSLRKYLKYPIYVSGLFIIGFYSASCLIVPTLIEKSSGHNVLVMIPALAIFFFICHKLTILDVLKNLVFFLWSSAIASFASGFTSAIYLGKNISAMELNIGLLRLGLSVVFLIVTFVLTHNWNHKFITDPNVPIQLWISFLSIPLIIIYININLIAYTPDMINGQQEFISYILILAGNIALFIILTNVFHSNALLYIESAKVIEEKRILEFQKAQYDGMTKDVSRTSKLLHDFKHTINALQTLAREENAKKTLSFLSSLDEFTLFTEIKNYCGHAPVNSVLNHYAFRASTQDVPLNLQVDLPDTIPFEDHEICSLIGNLMENAIDACLVLPKSERDFSLSVVMKDSSLIVVSSNTFDGNIKKSGDEYLSTKHSGFGIGIRSISETVEHYNGTMKIHFDEKYFYVDIMITI